MELQNEKRRTAVPQPISKLIPINLTGFRAAEIVAAEIQEDKVINLPQDKIKEALRYVFVLIGLHDIPEDAEKIVLLHHIYRNYPNLNDTDIRTAFELGIEDKLSIPAEEVVVKSFRKFSPAHFSKIMRAYKLYKGGVMGEARKRLPEADPYTPEVIENLKILFFNKIVIPMYWEFVEKGVLGFGSIRPELIYKSLIEHKQINPCDTRKRILFDKLKGTAGSHEKAVELARVEIIRDFFTKKKAEFIQAEKERRKAERKAKIKKP